MAPAEFWLIILFAFLFAAFRELSEHAKENGFTGWPDWFNTGKSWRNKHTFGKRFLPFLPESISGFIFKKVLVWTTDAEHCAQLLAMLSVLAAIYFAAGRIDLVAAFYIGQAAAGFLKIFTKLR